MSFTTLRKTLIDAAKLTNLTQSVALVQNAVGQTDGGLAGLFFSGEPRYDHGIGEHDDDYSTAWPKLRMSERHELLVNYLKSEVEYIELPDELDEHKRFQHWLNCATFGGDPEQDEDDAQSMGYTYGYIFEGGFVALVEHPLDQKPFLVTTSSCSRTYATLPEAARALWDFHAKNEVMV